MLVALAWNLAAIDDNSFEPDPGGIETLLWQCKHAVTYAPRFSTISYEKTDELLKDVLRRYNAAGASPRSVYLLASNVERFMGHHEIGRDYLLRSRTLPRDQFAETFQWELFVEVDHLIADDQEDKALKLMEPLLEHPPKADDVYPWFVCEALFPLLRRNRRDEALCHQRRAFSGIVGNPKFLGHLATHISFLCVVDQLDQALEVFQQHLRFGINVPDQATRFWFQMHSWFLMQRLLDSKVLSINVPKLSVVDSFPAARNGACDTKELGEWFERKSEVLRQEFNVRNGNEHMNSFRDQVTTRLDWHA